MADIKKANEINDEQLEAAAGGNYGDSTAEYKNKEALYKVGDIVEVYDGDIHIFTNRVKITKVDIIDKPGVFVDHYARYTGVRLDGSEKGKIEMFYADAIER